MKFLLEDVTNPNTFPWNGATVDKRWYFVKTICDAMQTILWPILIVVATAGSIYAIYLGINMAKAEDSGKRDEARKRLINAVIAMGVTVVLILLINLVIIPNMAGWLGVTNVDWIVTE